VLLTTPSPFNFLFSSAFSSFKARISYIYEQNYWVFGLFPSSGILEDRKHDVLETGSVSVLR
jgi:hypothetical protein